MSTPSSIFNLKIDPITSDELVARAQKSLQAAAGECILLINAHFANLAYERPWLRQYVNQEVEHVACEGRGLLLAGRLMGIHLPEPIRFSDWIHRLFNVAARDRYSIYFLGADERTVQAAAREVKKMYPELKIAGYHHGYFEKSGEVNDRVVDSINRTAPDILLTGLSMPLDELWLLENKRKLKAKLYLLGAGCFEWLSGNVPVCPRWLNRLYLQPLYRCVFEPRRLLKRYVVETPQFVMRVLAEPWQLKSGVKTVSEEQKEGERLGTM